MSDATDEAKEKKEDAALDDRIASFMSRSTSRLRRFRRWKAERSNQQKEDIKRVEENLSAIRKKREKEEEAFRKKLKAEIDDITGRFAIGLDLDGGSKKRKRGKSERRLNDAQRKIVSDALTGDPSDVVVSKFNVDMKRKKLRCVRDGTWLNDEVINFYIEILKEYSAAKRNEDEQFPNVHLHNSFFYAKLAGERGGYNYRNVRRWTRKVKIFDKDVVVIPINRGNTHWTCAAIFPRRKEIKYYDSMAGKGKDVLRALSQYVVDEWKDKKERHKLDETTKPDLSEWKTISTGSDVPQQHNGCDCGVFVCAFAQCLSCGIDPFDFSQKDMPNFRRHIALSIVSNGTLTPDLLPSGER